MALAIDGLIIIIYFVSITAIGLYMGRREKTLHDFALGGRNVPWWAVMASIIAAETSAATFLGAPGEGYETRSLAYVQLIAGLIIGRILVGYVFLKPYYTFKVYTVYDYLGIRFGNWSRNYVSGLFLFMRTLASGTRLFVPSLVMVLAWELFRGIGSGENTVKFHVVENVWLYVVMIVGLTLITCLYTAVGGIKAVIWTDVIQATLMFGSALVAIATLLYHIGGDSFNLLNGFKTMAQEVPQMTQREGYFLTGFEPAAVQKYQAANKVAQMRALDYLLMVLASPYTIFSAIIGSMFLNMAAFGTDQDMVQRLLTAETYKKARRSLITAAFMDLPIAAAFTFIGILLFVYYKQDPTFKPEANADVFGSYILNVMPTGIRGLVLAGVFATAMGSLSAALNALATSATNDWYIPLTVKYRSWTPVDAIQLKDRPSTPADAISYKGPPPTDREAHYVAAARLFTAIFALLMIVIASAFAYAKVKDPNVRIIPVVLGIAGFILGPMLGVFLLGMLTRGRGSDAGNMIAITVGLVTTIVLGELHIYLANLVAPLMGIQGEFVRPGWLPKVAFTWFALIGAVVVFVIGAFFATPAAVLETARLRAIEAQQGEDIPLSLRQGNPR